MDIKDFNNDQLIGLWCGGAIETMADEDLIAFQCTNKMNPEQLACWDQLDAQWKPTDDDIDHFAGWIILKDPEFAIKIAMKYVSAALKQFRENRSEMRSLLEVHKTSGLSKPSGDQNE